VNRRKVKIYDIYGFKTDSFTDVTPAVERAIGLNFEMRESCYRGGTYYKYGKDPRKENFSIQKNYNPAEEEWEEENYQEMKILLFVNNTERANKLKLKLMTEIPGITLIKRKEVREKSVQIQESDESHSAYSEAAA